MHILGLNFSIDAAASLVTDGRLVAAACEERFDRQKHSRAFPGQALRFCLAHAGIGPDDLDAVAFFWNPAISLDGLPGAHLASTRNHAEYLYQLPAQLLRLAPVDGLSRYTMIEIDRGARRPLRAYLVHHHLCHAQLAWRLSGWDEAAVLTLDGYGERSAGMLGRAGADGIEVLHETPFPHSLGSVYAAVTEFLGFRANSGEGKVMGLAAYGRPTFADLMARVVRPDGDGVAVDLSWFSYFHERPTRCSARWSEALGPARVPGGPVTERDQDLAASLQAQLEVCLMHLAERLKTRTGLDRLVYAGGVALNSLANGRLAESGPFAELFVPPAAGDAGTSAGAALWVHEHLGGAPAAQPVTDGLGPEFSDDALAALLARSGLTHTRPDDIAGHTAEAIAAGAVVGWFQGRMEFGPRALGQRSILADPRSAATFERLNTQIKFREPFRPYAPIVPIEHVAEWFDPPLPCPYMLKVLRVREERRDQVPAITHVDGTARVQTIDAARQPLWHRVVTAFGELTGVPILLNTSFNVRGEPIVARPEEALAMLTRTGMDALALGPFWVTKS